MDYILDLLRRIEQGVSDIVVAIVYLLIAFLVAFIVKRIVSKILDKSGAEEFLAKTGIKDEKTGKSTDFIGKLAFLVTFLVFLPAVLVKLGMSTVAAQITGVISRIIGFLPNLLAAGVILYIGIYVAKVVKQLVKALLNRVGLDKLQKKLGVETKEDQNTFTGVLSGAVYVLILIPVIIAALQTLGINAISGPATTILSQVFGYLPKVFVAIILMIVGYQLSKILTGIIENILVSVGTDKLSEKVYSKKVSFSLSKVISQIVRWFILIVFFIEAVKILQLSVITNIGVNILGYLPAIISAIVILGGGILLSSWVEGLIIKHSPKNKTIAFVSKIAIIILAAFMTLSQLGLAQTIVNQAFTIMLLGLAVAFAIAFGVGGRTFAANSLAKLEKKLDNEADSEEDK